MHESPGVRYPPLLAERMPSHLSYSALSKYTQCPLAYYLGTVRGLKEYDQQWLAALAGRAVHKATELIDGGLAEIADGGPSGEVFDAAFDAELAAVDADTLLTSGRKILDGFTPQGGPGGKDIDWWRHYGPKMVDGWLDFVGLMDGPVDFPDGKVGIELPLDVTIAGVPMVGYVDRVLQHRDTWGVVDIKTGREVPSPLQLFAYAEGIRETYGFPPDWVGFFYAQRLIAPTRGGGFRDPFVRFDVTEEWLDTTRATISEVWRSIQAGVFFGSVGDRCAAPVERAGCQYSDRCPLMGGDVPFPVSAAAVDPPWDEGPDIASGGDVQRRMSV